MAVLGATNLTGCNSIPDFIAGGSRMIFEQSTAPTSWTKQTTHNNKALRVVTGTATPGGSTAFTSVFASRTPSGTVSVSVSGGSVGDTTLTTPQIPSHSHASGTGVGNRPGITPTLPAQNTVRIADAGGPAGGGAGGNGAHSHPFTVGSASGSFSGAAQDFAVQYVDIIIAAKN